MFEKKDAARKKKKSSCNLRCLTFKGLICYFCFTFVRCLWGILHLLVFFKFWIFAWIFEHSWSDAHLFISYHRINSASLMGRAWVLSWWEDARPCAPMPAPHFWTDEALKFFLHLSVSLTAKQQRCSVTSTMGTAPPLHPRDCVKGLSCVKWCKNLYWSWENVGHSLALRESLFPRLSPFFWNALGLDSTSVHQLFFLFVFWFYFFGFPSKLYNTLIYILLKQSRCSAVQCAET